MAFAFKKRNKAIIDQMCGIVQIIMQRIYNERLIREFEGLLRGIKNLAPNGLFEIKKIDKNIILKLNQAKSFIDENMPEERVLKLVEEIGLQLLEREQKCMKTKRQRPQQG